MKTTTFPTLWDTIKAILRAKLIAIFAYIKREKIEKPHVDTLMTCLNALENQEEIIQIP